VESYRTDEEQVEALKRWWEENGRSTLAAIIIALSLGFAWQTWKGHDQQQREGASDAYQAMIQAMAAASSGGGDDERQQAVALAEALKNNYGDSTYAQFGALHLARLAVEAGDLVEAEAQLRWVLGAADKGTDTFWVAQLRLARVLAASGEADQALAILDGAGDTPYQASYAMARGDILLQLGRQDEARDAYTRARMHAAAQPGQVNLMTLDAKLQSLSPVAPQAVAGGAAASPAETDAGGVSEAEDPVTDVLSGQAEAQ
jgi:predicted negative regulator of RcsB-dependent stress response